MYTGKAWKHHISSDFGNTSTSDKNGAGKGGTIFLDYDKMLDYLKADGRKWHVAELYLESHPIRYDFGNNYMATILEDCESDVGFASLDSGMQVVVTIPFKMKVNVSGCSRQLFN